MIYKYKHNTAFYILIIFLAGFVLILPQIYTRSMILGSDSLFHFNRFYDTSQQIKHENFQYFISTYGFQQTGRIVTPLYSQLFSYFFGFILLLCGTWYRFQLISNLLLFFTAGVSMFFLLKKATMNKQLSLNLSLFYITTFSIFYWIVRQGYSSWGAAFLPLCLIPIIDLVRNKTFHPIQIGLAVALLFQLHFISSLFLIMIYFFAFIYSFTTSNSKKKLLLNLTISIIIFIVMTLNIWFSLLHLYSQNDIVQPFINKNIYKTTITGSSWYWLINPIILPIVILMLFFTVIKNYKIMSNLNKFFSLITIFFLILSSNLFPWKLLYESNVTLINFIQFPFRFFIPATICLICSTGLSIDERLFSFNFLKINRIVILICFIQAISLYSLTLTTWNKTDETFIKKQKHLFINSKNYEGVKQSFYDKDLKQALDLIEKSTPDYLPSYSTGKHNNYNLYEEYVLFNNEKFGKAVKKDSLIVRWNSNDFSEQKIVVPVIKYEKTTLSLNGKTLTETDLTPIGNPILESIDGENELVLTYNP